MTTQNVLREHFRKELFNFLATYDSDVLKDFTQLKGHDDIYLIDTNTINKAVHIFMDYAGIMSGSMNNVDYYKLMQVYTQNPRIRNIINNIVNEYQQI